MKSLLKKTICLLPLLTITTFANGPIPLVATGEKVEEVNVENFYGKSLDFKTMNYVSEQDFTTDLESVSSQFNMSLGDMDSGGGDSYAQEFTEVAYEVARSLKRDPLLKGEIDYNDLITAIESTRVITVNKLYLRGQRVDFINYPNLKMIAIDRERWNSIEEDYRKVLIVLHEYLGIMKIEDRRYQISGQLDRANVCSYSKFMRMSLESALGKSCWRIIRDDLRHIKTLHLLGQYYDSPIIKTNELKHLRVDTVSIYDVIVSKENPIKFSFINPNGLNYLYIGSLEGEIDENTFANIKYLKGLHFSISVDDNSKILPIKDMSPNTFSKNKTLEHITISVTSNSMDGLDAASFDLTQFERFSQILKDLPPSVRKVDFSDPIACNKNGVLGRAGFNDPTMSAEEKESLNKVNNTLKKQGFTCLPSTHNDRAQYTR